MANLKTNTKGGRDNIIQRILFFMDLAYLGDGFTKITAAQDLGVSIKTIERDLAALKNNGFEFVNKNGVIYVGRAPERERERERRVIRQTLF